MKCINGLNWFVQTPNHRIAKKCPKNNASRNAQIPLFSQIAIVTQSMEHSMIEENAKLPYISKFNLRYNGNITIKVWFGGLYRLIRFPKQIQSQITKREAYLHSSNLFVQFVYEIMKNFDLCFIFLLYVKVEKLKERSNK